MKSIALLAIGVVLALSGCSSSGGKDATPTLNAQVRGSSCQNYLPVLSKLKDVSQESANKTAEETISMLPQSAQWPSLSEVDRQSTIAGIRDAATGKC